MLASGSQLLNQWCWSWCCNSMGQSGAPCRIPFLPIQLQCHVLHEALIAFFIIDNQILLMTSTGKKNMMEFAENEFLWIKARTWFNKILTIVTECVTSWFCFNNLAKATRHRGKPQTCDWRIKEDFQKFLIHLSKAWQLPIKIENVNFELTKPEWDSQCC